MTTTRTTASTEQDDQQTTSLRQQPPIPRTQPLGHPGSIPRLLTTPRHSHGLLLPTKHRPPPHPAHHPPRRKSSYPAHQHQLRDDGIEGYEQPAASPAYQPLNTLTEQQQQKEDGELENDPEEEENRKELNDDDYTVRKREDLLNKDRLKILLEHFDPQQMDRYSEYRNSGLAKANVRKLANSILQQSVSERVTIVIRGFAKVFVGHMVEQALEVQKRRGGTGPIAQHDLKEAYRAYLSERDRGGSDRRKMFTK
ncbi:hypothetical protein PtB15_5B92 [Puccinia triticina]|nr:hypothetical protein PtB15_5B92 [Puccinia triticina]